MCAHLCVLCDHICSVVEVVLPVPLLVRNDSLGGSHPRSLAATKTVQAQGGPTNPTRTNAGIHTQMGIPRAKLVWHPRHVLPALYFLMPKHAAEVVRVWPPAKEQSPLSSSHKISLAWVAPGIVDDATGNE